MNEIYIYAEMANLAYGEKESDIEINLKKLKLEKDWKILKVNGNSIADNHKTGFQAVAFGKTDCEGFLNEIVIAFRGSCDPCSLHFDEIIKDWVHADLIQIGVGAIPMQSEYAEKFYEDVKTEYSKDFKDNNILIIATGHSLGGALVQVLCAKKGIKGYTFNAPGMAYQLHDRKWAKAKFKKNIDNYIIMNDPIGNIRDHWGKKYYLFPYTGNKMPHSAYLEMDFAKSFECENWDCNKSIAISCYSQKYHLPLIEMVLYELEKGTPIPPLDFKLPCALPAEEMMGVKFIGEEFIKKESRKILLKRIEKLNPDIINDILPSAIELLKEINDKNPGYLTSPLTYYTNSNLNKTETILPNSKNNLAK